MWGFMTTGTISFLKQLTKKHETIDFSFMKSEGATLVYYESEKKKSIFVSGRAYRILYDFKALEKNGFVVMDHIPVVDDGKDIFESKVKEFLPTITRAYGIQTIRFFKPNKSDTYCIMTQWKSENAYETFLQSSMHDFYEEATLARHSAYFAERPFTSTYYMLKGDE